MLTRAFALSLNAKEPDYAVAGKLDAQNLYNAHDGLFGKNLEQSFTNDTGRVATTQLFLDIALNNTNASGYTNDYGDKPLIERRSDGYYWVPSYNGYDLIGGREEGIFPFIEYAISTNDLTFEMTLDRSPFKEVGEIYAPFYFRLIKHLSEIRNIDSQTNGSECKEYFAQLNFSGSNRTNYDSVAFGQRSDTTNLTYLLDESE